MVCSVVFKVTSIIVSVGLLDVEVICSSGVRVGS